MRNAVCFLLAACLFCARAADVSVAAGVAPASKGGILPPVTTVASAGSVGSVASTGNVALKPAGATSGAVGATLPAVTAADLENYVPDDKYKLRVGDKISFQILEDRHWDDKTAPLGLMVSDSGELDIPYIGRLTATDKTCKQLAAEIKKQLEKDYYSKATVVLALDTANKFLGRIYVWGQVRNQGPIDIAVNENLTVGKAILRAGGFADFANKKRVKVIRGGGPDAAGKQTFELNLVEILEEGKTEKDVPLQPDDFIIVPSRLINF